MVDGDTIIQAKIETHGILLSAENGKVEIRTGDIFDERLFVGTPASVANWLFTHNVENWLNSSSMDFGRDYGFLLDNVRAPVMQTYRFLEKSKKFKPWNPESHWDDHPDHTAESWQYEVANGDTRQSYVEWVNARLEEAANERA